MKHLSKRLDKLNACAAASKTRDGFRIRYSDDHIEGISDAEIAELAAQGITVRLIELHFGDEHETTIEPA